MDIKGIVNSWLERLLVVDKEQMTLKDAYVGVENLFCLVSSMCRPADKAKLADMLEATVKKLSLEWLKLTVELEVMTLRLQSNLNEAQAQLS